MRIADLCRVGLGWVGRVRSHWSWWVKEGGRLRVVYLDECGRERQQERERRRKTGKRKEETGKREPKSKPSRLGWQRRQVTSPTATTSRWHEREIKRNVRRLLCSLCAATPYTIAANEVRPRCPVSCHLSTVNVTLEVLVFDTMCTFSIRRGRFRYDVRYTIVSKDGEIVDFLTASMLLCSLDSLLPSFLPFVLLPTADIRWRAEPSVRLRALSVNSEDDVPIQSGRGAI